MGELDGPFAVVRGLFLLLISYWYLKKPFKSEGVTSIVDSLKMGGVFLGADFLVFVLYGMVN